MQNKARANFSAIRPVNHVEGACVKSLSRTLEIFELRYKVRPHPNPQERGNLGTSFGFQGSWEVPDLSGLKSPEVRAPPRQPLVVVSGLDDNCIDPAEAGTPNVREKSEPPHVGCYEDIV